MSEFGCRWVVVDVETTGLDPEKHGIVEIAAKTDEGLVFELECDSGECECQVEALAINGRLIPQRKDTVDKLPSAGLAVTRLCEWLMRQDLSARWTLVGRNPEFDLKFLRKASGLAHRVFDREPVDLHDLVRFQLVRSGVRPARLTTNERYELLGWPPEPLPHTALQGVESEWAVFQSLLEGRA